jgi:tRNA U55 pseudouridine synthase TruB
MQRLINDGKSPQKEEEEREGIRPLPEIAATVAAPAVKFTMTISSGFYVRSLGHNLVLYMYVP